MPFDLALSAAAANAATTQIPVALGGGKLRVAAAVFTNATDAVGTYTAPIRLPAGARVLFGFINSAVTLGGTATVAIGIPGTAGKYRAAAVYTATDTFTILSLTAVSMVPLAADEQIIVTVAAASLPASGRWFLGFVYSENS